MREFRHQVAGRVKAVTSPSRRRQLVAIRFGMRLPTASHRVLPDALIIGAQRSGTSSLYKLLGLHPSVIPSLRKEVDYFTTRYTEGENWYRAHFPLTSRLRFSGAWGRQRPITFEATPDYLLDPRAAERAAALVPDARIVVLVRNPTDRAFSQYLHNRRLGHERLTFEEALAAEPERLRGELDRALDDPAYDARQFRRFSYITRGLYAEQIKRWSDHFGWERILVVRSEDFFGVPAETYARITGFLGLPHWIPRQFNNYSYTSSITPQSESVSIAARERLEAIFASHNQRLADMLGADLGWNDPPPLSGASSSVGEHPTAPP